jgi:Flp pilus assembly protein TadG
MTNDRGVVGLYVSVVFLAFLLVTGLIVDGGAIRAARRDAADTAARAARVGAQEIDEDLFMVSGEVRLDLAAAERAAESFLDDVGSTGSASATPDLVTVSVESYVAVRFLSIAGVDGRTVQAKRSARAAQGVSSG